MVAQICRESVQFLFGETMSRKPPFAEAGRQEEETEVPFGVC